MIASRWVVIALLGLYGATALPRRDRKQNHHDEDNDLESTTDSSILMVSGYWKTESSTSGKFKYDTDGFPKSMSTIMSLNVPTVIYGDDDGLADFQAARPKRGVSPLVGVHKKDVNSLEPCHTHGEMLRANPAHWTHPTDSPTVNLGCIFDGKIGVLADASRKHQGYDFYAWMDVGTPFYNNHADVFRGHRGRPWPHPEKLAKLPLDKISVAHSGNTNCDTMRDHPYEFWHCVAGTTFIVPAKLMGRVNNMFFSTLNQCIDFWKDGHKHTLEREGHKNKWGGYGCMSDSMILSVIAREHPELFNFLGTGWTAAAANLTSPRKDF